jgi:hypothetical protein
MRFVYHASGNSGITLFQPGRFWQRDNFSISGRLQDEETPPDGASLFYAFYATDLDFVPFYFAPKGVARIYLAKAKHHDHFGNGLRLLQIDCAFMDRVLIFGESDKASLESYAFSLYEFDVVDFRKLPTNEYVAESPVTPRAETTYASGLNEIQKREIHVHFVADLTTIFRDLVQAGIRFDAQGHF